MSKGYVYFITPEAVLYRRDLEAPMVKIGYTKSNPQKRLNVLQAGSPVLLEVHAYLEGGPDLENAFHNAFAELRSHREWFLAEGKLRHFLGYLESEGTQKFISREDAITAVHDVILAGCSPHPEVSDEDYLATADPAFLKPFFPEALAL